MFYYFLRRVINKLLPTSLNAIKPLRPRVLLFEAVEIQKIKENIYQILPKYNLNDIYYVACK